ncbi:hypothetical protein LK08_23775 [Streptomyces sp. MUSC 125]|nr:hypothetical protein LK08_23775 [Streptomyces sp. MUSC 125]
MTCRWIGGRHDLVACRLSCVMWARRGVLGGLFTCRDDKRQAGDMTKARAARVPAGLCGA